ncbi:MAG: MBL fold metallo-hydrolase, partial [Caldilineaceae bacterium]
AVRATEASGAPATPPAAPEQDLTMREDTPLVDSDGLRLHLLRFGPANGYLIETPAGLTLVDAGLPTSTRRVLRTVRRLGREDELCQIVITHAHVDHYGAADEVRQRTGARILVHEDDAEAMANGETRLGTIRSWEWTRDVLPYAQFLTDIRPTPADATLVSGQRLTACGLDALDARVVHTPGHTPGSITLLLTDPSSARAYAIAGDLFSTSGGAHIQSSYATSWLQLAVSVELMKEIAPDITFPGHGNTAIDAATLAGLPTSDPVRRALERAERQ